jgi:hypothetical protein
VSVTAASGANERILNLPNPGECDGYVGMDFLESGLLGVPLTTVDVVLAAGQAVTVTGAMDTGDANGVAVSNLTMNICFQEHLSGGGFGPVFGDDQFVGLIGAWPLQVGPNTIIPFTLTRTFNVGDTPPEIPAGTYRVGLCGCIAGNDDWQEDWAWLTVQVATAQ